MQSLPGKNHRGIIQIFPLLIAAVLIIGGIALASSNKNSKAVLSESNENTSATNISDDKKVEIPSQIRVTTGDRASSHEAEVETPEPKETPEADEFEDEEETEVKDGTHEAKIKIHSGKNKFEFQQEGAKISVESNFPLSVNPTTRELTVTTPAGIRVVAVLPQQAVDNMLANGIVSSTSGVNLETQNDGSLAYQVTGAKSERLLGIVPVTVPKTVIVSAQTGQVVIVNQSVFSKILDLLSI